MGGVVLGLGLEGAAQDASAFGEQGFGHLPKAGPSLKRAAAKLSPEWMVDWIEDPKAFRPRTRMHLPSALDAQP